MKRIIYLLLLPACLFFIPFSCWQEDDYGTRYNADKFFDASEADASIRYVASLLKQRNDSTEFVPAFAKAYGYPQWSDAEIVSEDDMLSFTVPLLHPSDRKRVNSVWFMYIKDNKLTFAPLRREDIRKSAPDQEMYFDYYSYLLFWRGERFGLCVSRCRDPFLDRWNLRL